VDGGLARISTGVRAIAPVIYRRAAIAHV